MEYQIKRLGAMGILSSITSVLDNRHKKLHEMVKSFIGRYECTTTFDKPVADIRYKEYKVFICLPKPNKVYKGFIQSP